MSVNFSSDFISKYNPDKHVIRIKTTTKSGETKKTIDIENKNSPISLLSRYIFSRDSYNEKNILEALSSAEVNEVERKELTNRLWSAKKNAPVNQKLYEIAVRSFPSPNVVAPTSHPTEIQEVFRAQKRRVVQAIDNMPETEKKELQHLRQALLNEESSDELKYRPFSEFIKYYKELFPEQKIAVKVLEKVNDPTSNIYQNLPKQSVLPYPFVESQIKEISRSMQELVNNELPIE